MTLAIFHHRRLVAGRVRLIIQAVLIAWMVGNSCALADYISMSGAENAANIAEIHIEEDSVRINLEVYVKDLAVFYHLLPDDFFEEKKTECSAPGRAAQAVCRRGAPGGNG
jgi:hypothetical protein